MAHRRGKRSIGSRALTQRNRPMAGSQPELRAVFCEALERKTAQARGEYLDQACEGKPELRARVDALLDAHNEVSGFLQEPDGSPPATAAERPDGETAGT